MFVRSLLAVALLVPALVAAGCLDLPGAEDEAPPAGDGPVSLLPDLSDVEAPSIDAQRARLWWESFVNEHPWRITNSPTNLRASAVIERDLAEAGYEVRTLHYMHPTGTRSPVDQGIRVIIGVKPGTVEPNHVIGWVAHYDTQAGTVYGAYDDGSGTAVAMELARALASYDNRKTLMPIFFDAEEIGLVASTYFVREAMQDPTVTYDLVIGHDMTGINCPGHEWKMWQFVGENYPELRPVLEELYDLKVPSEHRDCVAFHDEAFRNSDERLFKEAGVPVIRMAGGFRATDYPAYHKPNDTVEYVIDFAGGAENYEKGLELTILVSYWAAVAFDRLPSFNENRRL